MRKNGKESAAPVSTGADRDSGNGWLKGHWCVLALGIIVVVAFLLRFVFAYGVSADGDFALSGGSSAQYHLHVIESILNGTWSFTDASVNYPVGGTLFIPPLMDFLGAGVATLFQGSMGTTEAASMSLAVLNPIFGALACIPVYLIGKEMFDKTIGVVAALVFAFLALPISTSVFSSGNEYALAAFLLALMAYFAVKMVKAADSDVSSKKGIMLYGVLAGIFLALSALTWNGFRIAVILLVVAMVLQAVASRIGGKDFTNITLGYALAILVGVLVPAVYYIPAGLMDAVYSGPLMIGVVSVVFVFAFLALRGKPWVVTIPALVIAFLVIAAVLYFVAPEIFNDFLVGNSVYASSLMEELANNRVSMSNVAAYYGWLTMWTPLCLAAYEVYNYFKNDRSATRLFMIVWLFVMFVSTWASFATAAVVGSVFAVGAAGALVKLIRAANLGQYASDIKSAGFPGCFKKLIKPLPFITVLTVALLVIVPNFSFAVDAGQPTNTEGDHFYTGNTSFTIKTGDDYPVGEIWADYADAPKDGAIVTWIDYAYDSVAQGGFSNVTDSVGGGASAAAQMYLANGSAGAVAGMMLRIILSDSSVDYGSQFSNADVYKAIKTYINDADKAKAEIVANPDAYGKVKSDITDENAIYLASLNAICKGMNEVEICETYEGVCDASGEKIGYMLLDGSMLPLQYGDNGSFSTLAYFADYQIDKYGAAPEFFSYNTYYGSTVYTDAIYDTFLWKALIGPSAAEAGYTSSNSYLSALALSDGSEDSVTAMPGYGLAGFTVTEWKVMYNADDKATMSSEDWVYMDAYDAIQKQNVDGGMINYLYGIVMLQYTGAPVGASVISGEVVSSSNKPISGATVSVYAYDGFFAKEVLFSEATTIDGKYNVIVPSGDYRVDVKIGDLALESFSSSAVKSTVVVQDSTVIGEVQVNGQLYDYESMLITLTSDATEEKFDVVGGIVTIDGILPGTYTYALFGMDGTSYGTGSITIYPGASEGFIVAPKTYTITATVQDAYKQNIDGTVLDSNPIVFATNTETGAQFSADVGEDGKAVITVMPGKYTVALGNGLVSINATSQNATSGNRSVTLTAYESEVVQVSGVSAGTALTVSAGQFSTLAYTIGGNVCIDVPHGIATDEMSYSVYGIQNGKIIYGVYNGTGSLSLKTSDYSNVTGTLKNGDKGVSGTVTLYDESGFQVVASTNGDGEFSIYAPVGKFTLYAHNGSDKVCFGSVNVSSGNTSVGDVKLEDGRKITSTLKYDTATSDGNKNLPFVLALLKFTYGGTEYTLTSMTNTSGQAVFYMPDNVEAKSYINNPQGTLDNDVFACTNLANEVSSTTSNNSKTFTIEYVGYKEKQENVVKEQTITVPYDMTLEFYEDKGDDKAIEVKAGVPTKFRPGQYEATIDGSTGAYFDGTIYLYAGEFAFTGLDATEVVEVTITKAESDSLTIKSEGKYYSFTGGYYLQKDAVFDLTSTNKTKVDGKTVNKVKYATVTADGNISVDMTAEDVEMKVTGYIGVPADGTITVSTDAFEREFEIDGGAYTLVLPSSVTSVDVAVEATSKINESDYGFSKTAQFDGMTDGCIRNVAVLSDNDEAEDESAFTAKIDSATFQNGGATVSFTISNKGTVGMTYLVTAGSAWALDFAKSVTVGAGASVTSVVTGTYDVAIVAPGMDGVTLNITDINGKDKVELPINENSATGSAALSVVTDKGAAANKVSASQYMYAVTLKNDSVNAAMVTFTTKAITGWYVTLVNEDGSYVGEISEAVPVYGLETVTYYIALMQVESNGDAEVTVPSISVGITGVSGTVNLSPVDVQVETEDNGVSGGDAIDERSGVPSGIWFLVAVMILMIIAIFWLASKRGVFGRR